MMDIPETRSKSGRKLTTKTIKSKRKTQHRKLKRWGIWTHQKEEMKTGARDG
jgi:hypothetical protein